MDAKTERMKELVELLNQASKAYYQQDTDCLLYTSPSPRD